MPEALRIAYVTSSVLPSERANVIQSLETAKSLAVSGADVDFFCIKADANITEKGVRAWAESIHGQTFPFQFRCITNISVNGRFRTSLSIPALLHKVSSTGSYDLYYVRNCYLFFVLSLLGKQTVFEQHQFRFYRNRALNAIVQRLTLFGSKMRANLLFVCISEELRRRWTALGVPSPKTVTAHDAVDMGLFTPMMESSEAKRITGAPEDAVLVTYMGSLYDDRAISDIVWMASKLPQAAFRIIGGPEHEREKLASAASEKNILNVQFLPRVDRRSVSRHLFASDILLFTMNEQTITFDICSPLKIFEYMAAGRIIVAPDLPSIREVLKPAFSFFYEFPERDRLVEKVKEAIEAVQAGRLKAMGEQARRHVELNHTWDLRVRQILDALAGNGAAS